LIPSTIEFEWQPLWIFN